MNQDKFLYFRRVTDEASDGLDAQNATQRTPASLLVPASSLTAMHPTTDTTLSLYFKPVRAHSGNPTVRDRVDLTVTEGDLYEVMDTITSAINAGPHSDGFITIADSMTTTDSAVAAENDQTVTGKFIHTSISACATIVVNNETAGYGVNEYYEVIEPQPGDANDCVGQLSVKLPAQSVLLAAGLNVIELASNNFGAHALQFHNASVAVDAAGAGTEIIGAGTSANTTEPSQEDAECGADGTVGQSIITDPDVFEITDRGTAETFFHLETQEDTKSTPIAGTPKIGVYIKWFGGPAIAI